MAPSRQPMWSRVQVSASFARRMAEATWVPLGVNESRCANAAMSATIVYRMLVVPGQPTVVHAATNMGFFSYRENGSDCWRLISRGLIAGIATDLVADPFEKKLYVAFWSQGIFKSTDLSGSQWSKLGCRPAELQASAASHWRSAGARGWDSRSRCRFSMPVSTPVLQWEVSAVHHEQRRKRMERTALPSQRRATLLQQHHRRRHVQLGGSLYRSDGLLESN